MKASIILATYEWPEALALVLSALMQQTEKNFEVMIADDGSSSRTKEVIEKYKKRAFFPIQHFWQENKGFRKSKILNRAIHASCGKVLIFLDGDCIPHKEYVAQHIALNDGKHYIAGRRVDLSERFSKKLTPMLIEKGMLNGVIKGIFHLFTDSLRATGSKPFHRSYMVKNPMLRKIFGLEKVMDLKGCNFSVMRDHMLEINGFDESFEGYGREDTDVELRLKNLGLKIRSAKNLCLQFHLWHEPRAFTPANEDLLQNITDSKRVRAIKGIGEMV